MLWFPFQRWGNGNLASLSVQNPMAKLVVRIGLLFGSVSSKAVKFLFFCSSQAMVFPVVMYGWELDCEEGWVPNNWCFWTVVLEKTLESPLYCKEIQPVHSKGDSLECSLEGMMLKLKLQYFGHLMWRVDSLEKTLMLGGIGGRRRRGRQRMRWLDGITDSMDVSLSELRWWWTGRQGGLVCCDSWGRKESDPTERVNRTERPGWIS